MNYDKAELCEIALKLLKQGQNDLKNHGRVIFGAVAEGRNGRLYFIPLLFETIEEKYQVKANLRKILREIDARAALMLSEVWVSKTLPIEGTPGYTGSLKDVPGRREAISVKARSDSAQVMIQQVFTRNEGEFVFQEPMEVDCMNWVGEDNWLDGVWN